MAKLIYKRQVLPPYACVAYLKRFDTLCPVHNKNVYVFFLEKEKSGVKQEQPRPENPSPKNENHSANVKNFVKEESRERGELFKPKYKSS